MRSIRRFGGAARWSAVLVSASLFVFAGGCGGGQDKGRTGGDAGSTESPVKGGGRDRQLAQREFEVDPVLLGNVYRDSTLMLQFAPPRGWPPLDPSLMDAARKILDENLPAVERFSIRPHRIFYSPEKKLFMLISQFPNWPVVMDPYVAFAEYRESLQRRVQGVEMSDTFYQRGDLDVYQIVLTNPVMVNFRLMFIQEGRTPVQVDYLFPRGLYEEMIKGIEASVGSFQPYQPHP